MKKGRKIGTGKVKVYGRVMTGNTYRQTIINAIKANGNNWMTVNQIVNWGSDNMFCERKNAPRLAKTHPMWKIMSNLYYEINSPVVRRRNKKGVFVYRLVEPSTINVDGLNCKVVKPGHYVEA